MHRNTLLLLGIVLLLFGFLGAPVFWPLDEVLPNLGLRVLLWLSSSAGVLCLWLAVAAPPPAPRVARSGSHDWGRTA